MNLIGLVGRAGSGKDTVADILVRDHGWVKIALADPMKRFCREVFGFTEEQLWGPSSARNAPDMRYPREHSFMKDGLGCSCCGDYGLAKDCFLTPRHALQQLGTEWGRRCYDNLWVDYALRMAGKVLSGEQDWGYAGYTPQHGYNTGSQHPARGVAISDCRFPNEVEAIRKAGGVVWKTTHGSGLAGAAGMHSSESHIDSLPVDAAVPDGALEALPMIITTMLKETLHGSR